MRIMRSAKKAVKKAVAKRKAAAAKKAARKTAASAPAAPPLSSPMGTGRLIKIRGLGPIAEADIRLRPLTVFAGANRTGKSFACKAIYSFFSAMGDNHVEAAFRRALVSIRDLLEKVARGDMNLHSDHAKIKRAIALAGEEVEALHKELSDLSGGDFHTQIANFKSHSQLAEMCEQVQDACRRAASVARASKPIPSFIAASAEAARVAKSERQDLMEHIVKCASELPNILRKSGREIIENGMGENLFDCLTHNFQAVFLPRRARGYPLLFDRVNLRALEVEEGGLLRQDGKGALHFAFPQNEGLQWPGFSRAVFLDSPVYWKLKDALEKPRFVRLPRARRRLEGVPQYFYDLAVLLRERFPPSTVHDVFKRLEKIIGGKITLTKFGGLRFHPKGGGQAGGHSMLNTAAGVVNLGILSFLIEQGVITENAIVFIDEPESNLHPAWQEEMAETLARLVNGGVHVVVATHSDWMLSTIANIVRRGELGENGEQVALRKEQVGVWLFENDSKRGGSVARELRFDNISGYIPNDLRALSNALHNETADLLDEMDERERMSAVAEEAK